MTGDETWSERAKRFARDWAWHLTTVGAVAAVALIAPRQVPLIVYKVSLSMVGACAGYWLYVAFFCEEPEHGDDTARWQVVALMAVMVLSLSMGA